MTYYATKTYGHERGLSAAFRQWRATSHCRHLHGYALSVRLVFAANDLDQNGWVVDFGGLKPVEAWLKETFDHKLLVATDDPHARALKALEESDLVQVVMVERTGCEAFARLIAEHVNAWLRDTHGDRVWLHEVEVREHGANSAGVVADAWSAARSVVA